ncbi:MAG: restriction endonuclease subunit S [Veillonella sp.]|uniref:restriction endonuclease subunit S n=1 Tax=Veillonella sp. TaxID=1926307 RepID=UPI0025D345F7|nr:restriction endonuclease subunit S [Veillonella sp.]MBS4913368.1 restriction endonuclease subunit S [Veillonella sp.]
MLKGKKNAPIIRFQGFMEDWSKNKIANVAVICAGGTPSTSIKDYWEPKEVPWLSSGEVHKKYIKFTDNMISKKGLQNSSAKMIPANSVLIALAGQGKTRGTVAINGIPLVTNQSIAAMTFQSKIVPEFIFYNLETRYDELRRISSGDGTRGGLNKKLVGDIEIPYTLHEEQEKIGVFLKKLDNTSSLYQHRIDLLKALKTYFLQNMFPSEGEKVPKIRFKEFSDNWKYCKLSSLMKVRRGLTYSPNDICEDGIRVLRSSNIYEDTFTTNDDDVFVNPTIVKIPTVQNGDILITAANGSSRLVGKHAIIRDIADNTAVHGGFMLLGTADEPNFVNALLSAPWYKKFINVYVAGGNGAIGNLNKSNLDEQNVMTPSVDEQKQIGTYFKYIDNCIIINMRKYDQLQILKKFMLQNLFV